jgi:transposase-like protein
MPMPRAARAPHSSKVPEACPHCGSHVLTRRGTRKKKLEIVQLWRCASCKKTFTPGPTAIRGKTYPLRTVFNALSTYNLGYSLNDTAARMKSKKFMLINDSVTVAIEIPKAKGGAVRFVTDWLAKEARSRAFVAVEQMQGDLFSWADSVFLIGQRDPFVPPSCAQGLLEAIAAHAPHAEIITPAAGHFRTLVLSGRFQRQMPGVSTRRRWQPRPSVGPTLTRPNQHAQGLAAAAPLAQAHSSK